MGNTSGNHNTFGFSHDSLNLLNSEKVIEGKLKYISEVLVKRNIACNILTCKRKDYCELNQYQKC